VLGAPHLQAVDRPEGWAEQAAKGRVDQKLGRVEGNNGSVSFAARAGTTCMSRNERIANPASQYPARSPAMPVPMTAIFITS